MININFTAFPILETERLILRELRTTDDKDHFFLRSDEMVNKYLEGFRHTSIEETQAHIEKILIGVSNNECIFWVITLKDTTEFIGTICLWNISSEEDKAETGYTMIPDFQGQGYMQEALTKVIDFGFNTMKLRTIEAYTHKDNDHSTKLLLKCGFMQDNSRKAADGSKDIIFVLINETKSATGDL